MTDPFAIFDPICLECGLCKTSLAYRVAGEGDPNAEILLLGEALGEDEEAENRPFVGRAGWILNRSIREAGMFRSQFRITNAVRCRPTNAIGKNRPPTSAELTACRNWLDEEIRNLPNLKVIVALGASATWAALAPGQPMGGVLENQGKTFWSERYKVWVITTIHPAWALRKAGEAIWLTLDLMKAARIAESGQPKEPRQPNFRVVRTLDDAREMRESLLRAPYLVWDWETNGVHPTQSIGYCVSFCGEADFAWVVPRYGAGFIPIWSRHDLRRLDEEILKPIFLSNVPKIGHHVVFDYNITRSTVGVAPVNVVGCTMLAHHTLFNHLSERAHGLKRISDLYTEYGRYDDGLDRWLIDNGHTKGGKPDGAYIYRVPSHILWPYNATDSIVPWLVHPILEAKMKERDVWDFYTQERMPFALRYADMDRTGIRISGEKLATLGADLATAKAVVTAKIQDVVGDEKFNPNSHPQVAKYLFETRGLPVIARTETGAPSTKEEVLKEFENVDPAAALILHARAYQKLKSTFVDGNEKKVGGIKAAVDPDGYARMNTMQHVVETFRLATRKPFPVHVLPRPLVLWSCLDGHGRNLFDQCCQRAERVSLNIRSVVIARDGHVMLAADYVQQEYALIAIASGQQDLEEAMLDRGEDAHDYVMGLLSGKTKRDWMVEDLGEWVFPSKQAEDDYKNVRTRFKSLNFMIAYRGGAKRLGAALGIDEGEAVRIIEDYYERLYQIKWWQYGTIKTLRQTGRVVGLFKTYRELPNVYSPYKYDQYEAERQGCNFPFQNGGAHLLMRAVNRLSTLWERKRLPARLMFSVHDELVAEARDDVAQEAAHDMRIEMERAHPELVGACKVPRGIKVEIKAMREWNGKTIDLHGFRPREILRTPIPVAV